jgi:chromate transporter
MNASTPAILPGDSRSAASQQSHGIGFYEALCVWARVAALSFGGPARQIAVMHRILVEEKRWIGENRFLHALNYCMLLPGPEAQQLAVYIGWLLHKTKGGLVAGSLFVLPGAISIMALSLIYVIFGDVGVVQGLFFGLKAAVLAIVLEAVVRIGRRALKNSLMVAIAAIAFIAIFFLHVPFPLIVLGAGVLGFIGGRAGTQAFLVAGGHGARHGKAVPDAETALGIEVPAHARPSLGWSLKISAVFLVLWFGPILALFLLLGGGTSSPTLPSSSARWPSSPSAEPMLFSPMSRSRRSRHITG